jgi:hypothetical protein
MVRRNGFRWIHSLMLTAVALPLFGQTNPAVNFSGIVTDSAGTPIPAAAIKLENGGLTTTTGADGRFTLTNGTALLKALPQAPIAAIHDGSLFLSLAEKSQVTITAYGTRGEALSSFERRLDAGSHSLRLPQVGTGVRFFKVKSGTDETMLNAFTTEGASGSAAMGFRESPSHSGLAKQARTAAAYYDVLSVTKTGFLKGYLSISNSDISDIKIKMLKDNSPKFSFFVTSMKVLQDLADTTAGFGGDFRFGETGPGAGLRGADKICATIAERSMPGSSVKGWRAFLSVTADAYGKQVDAIDRIGEGPWYDRLGRMLAPKKADLLAVRPMNGDPTIQLDLPNENGIPNHRPDPNKPPEDNHHMVTGSTTAGKLKGATNTCKDWTTSVGSAANGKPTCGFAWPRGGQVSNSGSNWMSTYDAPGCAAGIEITEGGGAPPGSIIIGGGGGYGGFYCFALNP